jgi:hypothetical protein
MVWLAGSAIHCHPQQRLGKVRSASLRHNFQNRIKPVVNQPHDAAYIG